MNGRIPIFAVSNIDILFFTTNFRFKNSTEAPMAYIIKTPVNAAKK